MRWDPLKSQCTDLTHFSRQFCLLWRWFSGNYSKGICWPFPLPARLSPQTHFWVEPNSALRNNNKTRSAGKRKLLGLWTPTTTFPIIERPKKTVRAIQTAKMFTHDAIYRKFTQRAMWEEPAQPNTERGSFVTYRWSMMFLVLQNGISSTTFSWVRKISMAYTKFGLAKNALVFSWSTDRERERRKKRTKNCEKMVSPAVLCADQRLADFPVLGPLFQHHKHKTIFQINLLLAVEHTMELMWIYQGKLYMEEPPERHDTTRSFTSDFLYVGKWRRRLRT